MLRSYIESKHGTSPHPITGDELVWVACSGTNEDLAKCVMSTKIVSDGDFESAWRDCFEESLNSPEFPQRGPLWRFLVANLSIISMFYHYA